MAQNEQKMFWALNRTPAALTWDNTSGNNQINNGTGTWNFSTANWTPNGGRTNVIWRPGAPAIFGGNTGTGAAGTVTVSGTQSIQSMVFNPSASGNFIIGASAGNGTIINNSGNITANANATINSILAGSSGLTLSGTGTITLDTTTTYTGITTINSGTLLLSSGTANAYTPTLTTPIVIASGGTLTADISSKNVNLSGNISGAGTLTFPNVTQLQTFRLYGNNSGFTGSFSEPTSSRGIMWSDNQGTSNAANTGSAGAAWNLSGVFGFIETTGTATATVQLGSLSGTNTATLLGGFGGSGIDTFQIGALNTNTAFLGAIQDDPQQGIATIAVKKVGNGTLTLSGANTYSGTTTVSAGTLSFSGTGSAVPASNTWNIVVNATSSPSSSNSGLLKVPSALTFLGKTVNILLTGSGIGFTWTAFTCPSFVLVGPALQINGVGVLSGVVSGGTTVTFTGTSITVKR
ncbi:autotransporter-associated beta strand repeat-containing protein [Flavitalea flava]